jgi:predicted AAA+ superfamily ATPase
MKRFQTDLILKDLQKKMVFLVGPRQSGKTWLAKEIAKSFKSSIYLNYDSLDDKEIIDEQSWSPETELIIFDELHKKADWKNYIKGVFDTKNDHTKILVTGSARLDIYDHIGDSLAGRYFRHRLLPFSISEVLKADNTDFSLNHFLERGSFPEPFLAEDSLDAKRWRQQYINSLISIDVFSIEQIQNLNAFKLLFELLRKRVGSPVSFKSLAEDLQISPNTVKKYIQLLEALFIVFKVVPYSKNIARSLLKEPKIYFFDSALVNGDAGARFENFVAFSLLKSIYAQNDYLASEKKLQYIRTKDAAEVDFAITESDQLELMIEVKLSEKKVSKTLINFHKKYNFKALQIVQNLSKARNESGIEVKPSKEFLAALFL